MTNRIDKNKFDVIIAGGGASGMTAACCCAALGKKVCILEKNVKLGRKLSVTGNGKCNLTNTDLSAKHYYSDDNEFVEDILARYPVSRITDWFKNIGILCKDKSGYLYPLSEQAASVTGALETELKRLNVTVITGCEILSVSKTSEVFSIDTIITKEDEKTSKANKNNKKSKDKSVKNVPEDLTEKKTFVAEKLIMALGSPAAPVYGATGTGINTLEEMGHKTEPMNPALAPFIIQDPIVKLLAGVRLEAAIRVYSDSESYDERGEIIFSENAVSGIPVFQLSHYVSRVFDDWKMEIDLIPEVPEKSLKSFLLNFASLNPGVTYEYLFRGILNYKIVYYLMKAKGFDPEKPVGVLTDKEATKLCKLYKHFTLDVIGTKGFDNAQVSVGGLYTSELDINTLESKKIKNLFVTGELINVTGECGGYNLHFAWATGMIAGKAAGGKADA